MAGSAAALSSPFKRTAPPLEKDLSLQKDRLAIHIHSFLPPAGFSVRSLGMVATAISGTNMRGHRYGNGGFGLYSTSDCSSPDLDLARLRDLVDEMLFARVEEITFHEVTHLVETLVLERKRAVEDHGSTAPGCQRIFLERRRVVCEKVIEKIFFFPPSYLVSVLNSLLRWTDAAGRRRLSEIEAPPSTCARAWSPQDPRPNPSESLGAEVHSLHQRAVGILCEQLATKSRYFSADDLSLLLTALPTDPHLHLSLQREVVRRQKDFSAAEVRDFVSNLGVVHKLQPWFRDGLAQFF